jgi:hypothetical protein
MSILAVDVVARLAPTAAKVSMIVEQHDETRFRKCASDGVDAVKSGCAKSVSHSHGGQSFGLADRSV